MSYLLRARALSIGLVAATGFLLLVSLLASAALAALWTWVSAVLPGAAALLAALLGRLGLAMAVDWAIGATGGLRRVALLPLRDLLSFAIWATGLARSSVVWGGRRYRLRRDGSMVELRPGE